MIYNDFHNKKLSSLGLGTMRLPTLSNDGEIDEVKTAESSLSSNSYSKVPFPKGNEILVIIISSF